MDPAPPPAPLSRRRTPSTTGGLVYLLVVANTALGLLVTTFGPWRRGVALVGIGLVVGALLRMLLPQREAGMLRVRHSRWVDVLMLGGVGAALIVLASVIPNQTG